MWGQFEFRGKGEKYTIKITWRVIPRMIKRERSKGTEVTVLSLPSQKKTSLEIKKGITCFSKLKLFEKDRFILECFVKPLVVFMHWTVPD